MLRSRKIRSTQDAEQKPRDARWHRFLSYHLGVILISLVAIACLITLRVLDPFVLREARQTAFDLLQRAEPRTYIDAPIKIVDIDERSLEKLGQWPWPRDQLAELVDRLHAAGAAAVAFDFLFVEQDRMTSSDLRPEVPAPVPRATEGGLVTISKISNDEIFADALRRGNVVLGFGSSSQVSELPPVKAGFAFTGDDPAPYITKLPGGARLLPVLADAAAGVGSVNLRADNSARAVRVVQLLWSDGEDLYPSLITESLRIAQGAQTYVVHADEGAGRVQSLRLGGFDVPTGPRGELFLYYTKYLPERYVSAADIFDNERLTALVPDLTGKIILIGTSATGLFDLHRTALGQTVPGVEMHAQAMEQIIHQQFLVRKDWTRTAEVLAMIIACLSVSLVTIFGTAQTALLVGAAISAVISLGVWYSFRDLGVLVDFSFPLGSGLAVWFVVTIFRYVVTDREKRGIRTAFSRYVHPEVLKDIERNYSHVQLGGENCDLTVMFTDVRNFTPLSERLAPEEVVSFLNRLLGRLGSEITQEAGVIDKFIGDSVMAFWNAPLRQPDHCRRACAAALKMRAAVEEMNAEQSFGLPEHVARDGPIEIGVGINTGPACVGNVGSAERFNYSAIGDAVNVAARAESACKEVGYDLVVCRSTAEQVPDFAFLDAGGVALKGKTSRVSLMVLVGDETVSGSPDFAALREKHARLLEALGRRDPSSIEEALEACRPLARRFGPKLVEFINKMPTRLEDFAAPETVELELIPAS
ncbi:CHASE2 domain-containing protein [Thermohalobaculum xanthum]|uniref:CHASE2 domain-containing protein n=1 Tax=Thermohalobaculum xanthum TaxID=2753746 RepID=UPI002D80D8CF|nr:adenylate/guanylate cyclase domain-containing protein [Thermohalobaculum xanthum]